MDLLFEDSVGKAPEDGSLEEDLLLACSAEDMELWDRLCEIPRSEIEQAVANLRRLGWRFHWETLH
jgi:hypothetical protein